MPALAKRRVGSERGTTEEEGTVGVNCWSAGSHGGAERGADGREGLAELTKGMASLLEVVEEGAPHAGRSPLGRRVVLRHGGVCGVQAADVEGQKSTLGWPWARARRRRQRVCSAEERARRGAWRGRKGNRVHEVSAPVTQRGIVQALHSPNKRCSGGAAKRARSWVWSGLPKLPETSSIGPSCPISSMARAPAVAIAISESK